MLHPEGQPYGGGYCLLHGVSDLGTNIGVDQEILNNVQAQGDGIVVSLMPYVDPRQYVHLLDHPFYQLRRVGIRNVRVVKRIVYDFVQLRHCKGCGSRIAHSDPSRLMLVIDEGWDITIVHFAARAQPSGVFNTFSAFSPTFSKI